MMKNAVQVVATLLPDILATHVGDEVKGLAPGSFEGLGRLRAGDINRARQIWLPLAEQGNPVADNLGTIAAAEARRRTRPQPR
jgi:hypothetical protein